MELDKSNERIAGLFDDIAPKYDRLNHLLSLDIDRIWRRKTVKRLFSMLRRFKPESCDRPCILDLACGTGDLSGVLFKKGAVVAGADISDSMLAVAKKKNESLKVWADNHKNSGNRVDLPEYYRMSAERILFEDCRFDAVTISFGFRNFENRPASLNEIHRVLKDNGVLAILEFSYPDNLIAKFLFNIYFRYYLPFIGGVVSKNRTAYRYLVDSVISFPRYEDLCNELREAGFKDVSYRRFTFGIASLYTGVKQNAG